MFLHVIPIAFMTLSSCNIDLSGLHKICGVTWEYRHSCFFSSPLPEGFFLHMFLFTYTAAEHWNGLVEEGGVGTHRFMRNMETACSISDQSEDSTDATHPSPHLACQMITCQTYCSLRNHLTKRGNSSTLYLEIKENLN